MLSDRVARRTLASLQRGEGCGRGNSQAVRLGRQPSVSEPAARQGIQKGNSLAIRSGRQANVSEPGRDPEGGTHSLTDQADRRTLASRQRGEGRENSPAVRSGPRPKISEPAAW